MNKIFIIVIVFIIVILITTIISFIFSNNNKNKCVKLTDCRDNSTCKKGLCVCSYGGTMPNCNSKPSYQFIKGSCSKYPNSTCAGTNCVCSYGGTMPNCNSKPECTSVTDCSKSPNAICTGGKCECKYDGDYPTCNKRPAYPSDGCFKKDTINYGVDIGDLSTIKIPWKNTFNQTLNGKSIQGVGILEIC